jgi:hypothetical protein
MNPGSPREDPGNRPERLTFRGPFHHVTACREKSGSRKQRWSLLFLTGSTLVIMPVPETFLQADDGNSSSDPGPVKPAKGHWPPRNPDGAIRERLGGLVRQYREKDPEETITAEPATEVIPLDTVKDITITWVRGSGHYSRLLFFFSGYPAEPANAGYHVTFRLAITLGSGEIVLTTPFSPELRQALRDLLGERLREIPDPYAPLL